MMMTKALKNEVASWEESPSPSPFRPWLTLLSAVHLWKLTRQLWSTASSVNGLEVEPSTRQQKLRATDSHTKVGQSSFADQQRSRKVRRALRIVNDDANEA